MSGRNVQLGAKAAVNLLSKLELEAGAEYKSNIQEIRQQLNPYGNTWDQFRGVYSAFDGRDAIPDVNNHAPWSRASGCAPIVGTEAPGAQE